MGEFLCQLLHSVQDVCKLLQVCLCSIIDVERKENGTPRST